MNQKDLIKLSMSVIALTHGTPSWGEDAIQIQNLVDEGRKVRPFCNDFKDVVKKYSASNPPKIADVIRLADRYPGYPCDPIPLFDFEEEAIDAASDGVLGEKQKEALNFAIVLRARNELQGTLPLFPILLEISILNQLAHSYWR